MSRRQVCLPIPPRVRTGACAITSWRSWRFHRAHDLRRLRPCRNSGAPRSLVSSPRRNNWRSTVSSCSRHAHESLGGCLSGNRTRHVLRSRPGCGLACRIDCGVRAVADSRRPKAKVTGPSPAGVHRERTPRSFLLGTNAPRTSFLALDQGVTPARSAASRSAGSFEGQIRRAVCAEGKQAEAPGRRLGRPGPAPARGPRPSWLEHALRQAFGDGERAALPRVVVVWKRHAVGATAAVADVCSEGPPCK